MRYAAIAILSCVLAWQNHAFAASESSATPSTNCPEGSKATLQVFLTDVLTWLNSLQSKHATGKLEDVKRYFAPNMEIHHNGRLIATGYTGFYKSQMLSRRFVTEVVTHLPLQDVLLDDHKAAFHTTTTLTKKNHPPEEHEVIAMLDFSNCKIVRWREVSKKIR